jgi:Kdo2-lipid IVA lauroyltransferase/acyltransferase
MQAITYYTALPFIYLISLLPFPVLYLFSDAICFLLFRVLGYRKKVVFTNLRNSFPGKSEKEIRELGRQFYHYLVDLMLETFKTLTVSSKKTLERCTLDERAKEMFEHYGKEKRSIIIVMGHYGNWEWAGSSFSLIFDYPLYVIYHPLRNKYFNDLIYKMRTRFGTRLIAMRDTYKEMAGRKSEMNATAFIADQTPPPENAYWTMFLHQDTPVFWGTEKIAQKLNYPVVYVTVKRLKRGYYRVFAEELFSNPRDTATGEISEAHTRKLERDIMEQPEIWLWSHRRWKHKRPSA